MLPSRGVDDSRNEKFAMKTKHLSKLNAIRFCLSVPSDTVYTPFSLPVSSLSSWTVYRYLRSKNIRGFTLAVALVTCGISFIAAFADDTAKKADEPWTAPARAARKEKPAATNTKIGRASCRERV